MAKLVYLLLDLGTLAAAIGMGLYWSQPWLKQWRQTAIAIGLAVLPFVLWDIWATAQGHWSFNAAYTTGLRLFGLPVEEILFFPVVSLAALAVWQRVQGAASAERPVSRHWLAVPTVAAGVVFVAGQGRGYSMAASVVALLFCAWLVSSVHGRGLLTLGWLRYQVILLVLFALFNSLLTGLPVVLYGEAHIVGWRLGSIPVEDVLFNFVLVNLVVVWADAVRRRG